MREMIAIIVMTLPLLFTGCKEPKELVSGKHVIEPEVVDISNQNVIVTDFAVRLLKETFSQKENTLISPVSVLSGLALVSNGVEGETLAQIEDVVGLSAKEIKEYMYSYSSYISEISGKNGEPYLAESLWINENKDVYVSDEFLQANESYCNASIYEVPFDEMCTKYTNTWIKNQTKSIVGEIINEVPKDATIYLANGVAFEGVWKIRSRSGKECEFKNIDGTMYYSENGVSNREMSYLEDENAVGFIKYFGGSKYALASLMPDNDIDISEYIKGLTGEKLQEILSNPIRIDVDTVMPSFSFAYGTDMKNVLKCMGIKDVFTENADDSLDFNHMWIDNFFYQTSINIDANGMNTKLRAAVSEDLVITAEAWVSVNIDRPFIIVVLDCENNIPLLIGTVVNIV